MKLGPDTYAMLRNTVIFEAHRERQRLARRAGQPFLAIALGLYAIVIGGFVWTLVTAPSVGGFRALVLPMEACLFFGGICFAIAGIRIRLWQGTHPEPSSRPGRQAGL
jgi:hypothetical protein